ncbi:MAG: hypothetical protein HGB21_12900 [Nitrospirae bacterium]|nr:hypothetical protein [Nitrospirota bacterium]
MKGHAPRDIGQRLFDDYRQSLGVVEDGAVFDYQSERTRLTHHQANVVEVQTRLKRGELMHSGDVLRCWSGLIATARAKMLSLPSRLASSCAMRSSDEVRAEAARIVDEARQELVSGGTDGLGNTTRQPQMAQAGQTSDTPTK